MNKSSAKQAGRHVESASQPILAAAVALLCAGAAPDLPASCSYIAVPEGNKVCFHAYAVGVQIYRWTGTAWAFIAPAAVLYADADHVGEVGIHYAGPTWESNSGSKVVGLRIAGCTPDANAIPWLLLKTVTTEGPGILHCVSYIQRVNTVGGLAPAGPGAYLGEQQQVPYSAEYFFYRPERPRSSAQ